MIGGDIAADGPRRVVTVERELPIPVAELRSALTDGALLAQWTGDPADAERGLELTCTPEGEGRSRLVLVQRDVPAVTASVHGARWQEALTRLAEDGEADSAAFASALHDYREREARLVLARMRRAGERSGIRLERLLDADAAAVWDAITLPGPVGRWMWPVVEWPDDPARERSIRLGDIMRLGDANVEGGIQSLEVLALEERRLLRLSWGDAAVTLRLEAVAEGTLLTLDQDPAPDVSGGGRLRSAPDFAAGWHQLIDRLSLVLSGRSVPEPDGLWEAAYTLYAAEWAAGEDAAAD